MEGTGGKFKISPDFSVSGDILNSMGTETV